jgi:hypothetical protein
MSFIANDQVPIGLIEPGLQLVISAHMIEPDYGQVLLGKGIPAA